MTLVNESKIIIALDYKDEVSTMALVEQLEPSLCKLKVGKELFVRCGPSLVKKLISKGFDVFLDLKFHDIPNTVAAACQAAADMGVWMVNVHASGGRKMMQFAREAIDQCEHQPLLIGVTILTSLSRNDIAEVGLDIEPAQQVLRLANLANDSGLDGVVCSPQEVKTLKQQIGKDFCLVTPGVRPAGTAIGDQQRVMTPSEALSQGSDYLVIGRPITADANPVRALKSIIAECL
ncbi:MAG: orotidine-5'-phosphate decarboxylase [gamma proteobacterium symbiont of Bathyaustriella thionipta]|nr:orotidine-5'-phosphate decarboxylase [gamma proteobacterium symbiont of Bathyaustriella thionipta]MCU7949229.1 orotidine-5'-phosphate decarboxylase [gamma proteobacterium symbiont of Bathyaustriella thionipta]MCU7954811.1 orotidine-5'-phosphate decarboxylase [gamma proteobacterium symbiont of Bathyaustriella thionipta]MCU7955829.1 orotidine-5'-phosphate decarboxylase [gamma proteobacterium symbiont of Bathyaustriella thionipta]MCU7967258.1 orotidine-5'-phosphate decarboxylase [gamma proteoba